VDGIQFNDDDIIFVEIKTGHARLSKPQKKFKQLVKEGKVKIATFRVSEDGSKLLIEDE
jgi:predicted Holliday junction resolvase-like endonuclease